MNSDVWSTENVISSVDVIRSQVLSLNREVRPRVAHTFLLPSISAEIETSWLSYIRDYKYVQRLRETATGARLEPR